MAFREAVVSDWILARPSSRAVMLKQVISTAGGERGGVGGAGWGQVGSVAGFFGTVQQVLKSAAGRGAEQSWQDSRLRAGGTWVADVSQRYAMQGTIHLRSGH